MRLSFVKGNIIDSTNDAVVLPANSALREGTGASNAIFKAAGRRELTKKCKEIGHCDIGMAVPTLGYNLDAKYIIHAVVPKWIDGMHYEYALLCSAYASALELADHMECKSIAFPLLSAGNNGFNLSLAVEIAIKSIEEYKATNLEEAVVVLYSRNIVNIVEAKGYTVIPLIPNLAKDAEKMERALQKKQESNEARKEAVEKMKKQVEKGILYFTDPANVDRLLGLGEQILALINNAGDIVGAVERIASKKEGSK